MRSNFSKLVLAILLSFFVVLTPLPALAAGDYGLEATADAAGLKTNKSIPELVGQIVGAGLSLLGLVFLGLMLYGGFRWMTARGDTKSVDTAKDTITNAVIGLAIIVGAYAITDFSIKAITGAGGGGGGGGGAEQGADAEPAVSPEEQARLNRVEDYNSCLAEGGSAQLCERILAPDCVGAGC